MGVQTACFVVEGEWLTEFARTRVREGRWDHALQTLECLEGITMEQMLSILRGDAKLTGDSSIGVDLEPDDDTAFKDQLAWHYAGCYVDNDGRYLRPYAILTSWGPEDYDHGAKTTKGSDSMTDRRGNEKMGCSLFYADDPLRDVARLVKADYEHPEGTGRTKEGYSIVLYKEVRGYPFQLVEAAPLGNAQAALDAYLAAGLHLKPVGYLQLFPPELFKVRYDVAVPTEPRPAGHKTHMALTTEDAQYDAKEIGRARFDKINAEKNGVDIEDWLDYQDRMQGKGSIVEQHMSMLEHAHKAQEDFTKNHAQYVLEIVRQAGDQWLSLGKIGKEEVRVPRAPFENWCLWRGDGAHLALPWEPVCPSGLKMFGDDPYHTDFLIGAGLDLDAMADHNSPLSKAVWAARKKVQEEKLGFKVAVLCGTGVSPTLRVVHPKRNQECKPDEVAVIPNAGPSYVAAAMSAGAVICEQGGAMAHLVTVSREKDIKIVRVEGARKLYPEGMHLVVDCAAGEVSVPFNRIDYKMKLGGVVIDVDTLPRGDDE